MCTGFAVTAGQPVFAHVQAQIVSPVAENIAIEAPAPNRYVSASNAMKYQGITKVDAASHSFVFPSDSGPAYTITEF